MHKSTIFFFLLTLGIGSAGLHGMEKKKKQENTLKEIIASVELKGRVLSPSESLDLPGDSTIWGTLKIKTKEEKIDLNYESWVTHGRMRSQQMFEHEGTDEKHVGEAIDICYDLTDTDENPSLLTAPINERVVVYENGSHQHFGSKEMEKPVCEKTLPFLGKLIEQALFSNKARIDDYQ
jgi:hypothetical protein